MEYSNFKSVEGKVAIVTGGASGIGRATVETFAKNGMKVIIADISDETGIALSKELKQEGLSVDFYHTNMMEETDIENVVKFAVEKHGKLHVMVNNAGIGSALHPIHEFDSKTIRRVTEVNYIGTYLGMKYAAKAMIETDSRGAAIINIGSAAAQISSGGYSLYDSTKAAVLRLTKAGALDYAEHDITVNSVSPGVIETEIYAKLSPVQLQRSLSKCPTGHMGKPSDIANMCLFLATDMARYVTGAIINVDGGQTIGPYMPCTWENPDTREF